MRHRTLAIALALTLVAALLAVVLPRQSRATSPANAPALLRHTVTLSSADILGLNATTYNGPALVAAPPPGKMVVPHMILAVHHFGTSIYVFGGGSSIYVSTTAEYSSSNGGSWFVLARRGGLGTNQNCATVSGPDSTFGDDVSLAGANGQPLGLFTNTPITNGDGTLTLTTDYTLEDAGP